MRFENAHRFTRPGENAEKHAANPIGEQKTFVIVTKPTDQKISTTKQ